MIIVFQVVSSDVRLYWHKSEGKKEINFNDIPFSVNEMKVLDCQFGGKYYKEKSKQGKKVWLQGTRKMGCMAHIEVKGFTLYPEYGINQCEKVGLSKWKVQCLKEDKLKELNKMLRAKNPVKQKLSTMCLFHLMKPTQNIQLA